MKVHFIGKEAEDQGGPRRELLPAIITGCYKAQSVRNLSARPITTLVLLLECLFNRGDLRTTLSFTFMLGNFVACPSSSRPISLDGADHDMRMKIEKVKLADLHIHELMRTRK